ncbi:transposase family protein [Acidisoma silvae]|uniref:Transposase family protein n=1 Tax=Acidisoma silvae TaxID=2802396 RepID=A0A963YWA4_9PROT|nr:transposase family protein [Acidisoma silvae]
MSTRPKFIVIKAADSFHTKTTAPNQLWQTDFTYLKVIGWGWAYLSTVLNDYSCYIVAWKLCITMAVRDVTETLNMARQASGLHNAAIHHRPRLLSDNGPSYVAEDLAKWLGSHGMDHISGPPSPHCRSTGREMGLSDSGPLSNLCCPASLASVSISWPVSG